MIKCKGKQSNMTKCHMVGKNKMLWVYKVKASFWAKALGPVISRPSARRVFPVSGQKAEGWGLQCVFHTEVFNF